MAQSAAEAISARRLPRQYLVWLGGASLPQAVLLLVGGAVGDRLGARRVMITCNSIMLVVAAIVAVASWSWGTPLALLVAAGLVLGTVNAFYLPSSGSMPRQLVEDSALPRALALRLWRPADARSRDPRPHRRRRRIGTCGAVAGHPAESVTAGVAFLLLVVWVVLYLRISAPINRTLTAAADAHETPANARALQRDWIASSSSAPSCKAWPSPRWT